MMHWWIRGTWLVLLMAYCPSFFAQPSDWTVIPSSFEFSMTATFTVSIDGLVGASDEDVAAVFDSDGVCRGIGTANFAAASGYYTGIMLVYSNGTNDPGLEIRIWDASMDSLPTCLDEIDFVANGIQGSLLNPLVFYGVYDPLVGCTDPEACNYLNTAIEDNGACIYPGCSDTEACNFVASSPCYDNASCVFPPPFLDCEGACISDFDGDGICDEFEVGGCTDSLACNFNIDATDDDCSCAYPLYPLDCNGNCYLDSDNDGVCEGDEVNGCDDDDACNYNSEATENDGSCEFCCFSILNASNGFTLEVDIWEPEGSEVDALSELVTYRLYLVTSHPGDRLLAVQGINGLSTAIGTNSSFYQSSNGGLSVLDADSASFVQDEEVRRDSWITIGAETPWELATSDLQIIAGPWVDIFETGGTLFLGATSGNGWSLAADHPLALAGPDQRILIGQFTSGSPIEGQISCSVLPYLAEDPIQINPFFIAPPCGCIDPMACNYEFGASYDDGSCLYPPTGLDCVGDCISDADLDGICDEDEIPGCTDFNADNYNPNATDNTFQCAYLGCTYFIATNYSPTANVDDGTCSFSTANPCPTDINGDGITAASDILEMLGQYGTECQY